MSRCVVWNLLIHGFPYKTTCSIMMAINIPVRSINSSSVSPESSEELLGVSVPSIQKVSCHDHSCCGHLWSRDKDPRTVILWECIWFVIMELLVLQPMGLLPQKKKKYLCCHSGPYFHEGFWIVPSPLIKLVALRESVQACKRSHSCNTIKTYSTLHQVSN